MDALVTLWDHYNLIYAFLILKVLAPLLCRIEMEGIPIFLSMLKDVVLRHTRIPGRLFEGPSGSSVEIASVLVAGFNGMTVKAMVRRYGHIKLCHPYTIEG